MKVQPLVKRLSWSTDALVISAFLPCLTHKVVVAVLSAQEVGPVVALLTPRAAESHIYIPCLFLLLSPLLTLPGVTGHDVAHDVLLVERTRRLLEHVTVI